MKENSSGEEQQRFFDLYNNLSIDYYNDSEKPTSDNVIYPEHHE